MDLLLRSGETSLKEYFKNISMEDEEDGVRMSTRLFDEEEMTSLTSISEDEKLKMYKHPEFKEFLINNSRYFTKKKLTKISDKNSERIYRHLFKENVAKMPDLPSKILAHPDVTSADFIFVHNILRRNQYNYLIGQGTLFTVLGLVYFKTELGKKIRSRPIVFSVVYGLSPLLLMGATYAFNRLNSESQVRRAQLHKKYNLIK